MEESGVAYVLDQVAGVGELGADEVGRLGDLGRLGRGEDDEVAAVGLLLPGAKHAEVAADARGRQDLVLDVEDLGLAGLNLLNDLLLRNGRAVPVLRGGQ